MPRYRSKTSTHGRNMAGARALWRATGMKDDDFQKPIIAIANSFTQFVPGHVHLKDMGQLVAREVEKAGGVAKEFNTIAVDDGIAMGHDGMLYSLPSRDIIADSIEYMVNAHCADALVCISNCDKITPGMLNASLRLNIPTIFVSGGPMEAGRTRLANHNTNLIHAIVVAADEQMSDAEVEDYERSACPTCGSCSGMFTANSMNCLTEVLGLSLPGNGSMLATHADREQLFLQAGRKIVEITKAYYEQDDETVLPRNIANLRSFKNAMSLDIAMGGSTNTILHLLAAAQEGEIDFDLSRCLFIFSYNDEAKVNPILRDRMYRIHTKGYDQQQKTTIANNHLLPKIREQVKFNSTDILIPEETVHHLITTHTEKEDGVRNLKRCLEIIHTKLNLYRLMKPGTNLFESDMSIKVEFPLTVTPEIVDKLIKKNTETGSWTNMYS